MPQPTAARSEMPAAIAPRAAERMHIVVTGHVDHGKSSVIGRLLADTGSLPEGKLDSVRRACERHAKPFEYAFLLDALKDEQAQGITIESTRVFFNTARRQYVIVDAPGHVEFLKNMITGAARAEAALLVIDAREGVQENSRRHGYLLATLGIRQIAVLVNKMDLVDYDREVFTRIVAEYTAFLEHIGLRAAAFIPISARTGENIAAAAPSIAWYEGPTTLEVLSLFETRPAPTAGPFRMPVQGIYKFTEHGDDRRIIAGTITSGRVTVGDEVVFYPSGKASRIRTLEAFHAPAPRDAGADEAVGFTLTDQLYLSRGEIAVKAGQPKPLVATRIAASVFWLGRRPLSRDRTYVLKIGTARVAARVETIHRVIDASSLGIAEDRVAVERHEAADCTLSLVHPTAVDTIDRCLHTSRFVIVDDVDISGGGIVRDVLPDATLSDTGTCEPAVVWLTGLSGAGKSTIGERLCAQLASVGARVEYLDGDAIRDAFPSTGFSRSDRDVHVKRVGFLASRLEHHGVIVVCALISPYATARAEVRRMCRRFIEVHVSTPLPECERRDVKGLYARARRGEIAHFTGIDDPYEAPAEPELRLDTTELTVDDAVARVMAALR